MSNSATCRICLLSGSSVRFHSFRNTPLQIIFEKFTHLKLNTKDGKPESVCYICCWQLHCCRTLQKKAEKSLGILTQLNKHEITISEDTISVLNQEIVQQYSISPVDSNSYWPTKDALVKEEKIVDEVAEVEEVDEVGLARDSVGNTEVPPPPCEGTVCRVCLNARHKTRAIVKTKLHAVYEKLASTKLTTEDNIPDTVCYICVNQLRKLYKLFDQAKKSDTILNELTRNGIQLTPSSFWILNKRARLNLSTSGIEIHSFKAERSNSLHDQMVPIVRLERITVPVKREPQDECDPSNYKTSSEESENVKKCSYTNNKGKNLFCQLCDYRCASKVVLTRHQQFHDQNRAFSCKICRYRFGTAIHLRQHIISCHNTKHKCSECGKRFSNRRNIKRHMFSHYTGMTYTCEVCAKIFATNVALRHHIYICHPEQRRKCEYCPIYFMGTLLLREHILKIHAVQFPYYICDICKKRFPDKSNLRKHMIHVHDDKVEFTCDYCRRIFGNKNTLKVHMQLHVGKSFKCPDCPKAYSSKAALKYHASKHTGLRPFICDICNKCYRDKYGLSTHKKTHKGERPYVCKICLKAYAGINSLNYHNMVVHSHAEKSFVCEICDRKFFRKEVLIKHMKTHDDKRLDDRPYLPCGICHKVLRSSKGLDNHLKAHAGQFNYNCYKCNKSFLHKGNYKSHMKFHYGLFVKKYICDSCDGRFRTKHHLEIHIRSHTKEKPYACDLCDKSFSQNGALKLHMRAHTGEKPYVCGICNKRFNEKRSLDVHILLIHTEKKQFICDICNKVYTSKDMFTKHVKKHYTKTPHTCFKCEDSFRNLKTLSEHVKTHADKCSICRDCFSSGGSLRRHYLIVHGEYYSIACNICEKGFNVEHVEGLRRHIRVHRGEKPYVCEICDLKYTKVSALKQHKRKYHT